ncbi:MAG: thiamine pyrophosphate-dependent enzyme, partial [Salinigranum sp.]
EVEEWRKRDPIPRLEAFLKATGRLDDERIDAVREEVDAEIAAAVEAAESEPRPAPESMFEYVFAEKTPDLEAQRESLEALRDRYGDEAFLRR